MKFMIWILWLFVLNPNFEWASDVSTWYGESNILLQLIFLLVLQCRTHLYFSLLTKAPSVSYMNLSLLMMTTRVEIFEFCYYWWKWNLIFNHQIMNSLKNMFIIQTINKWNYFMVKPENYDSSKYFPLFQCL